MKNPRLSLFQKASKRHQRDQHQGIPGPCRGQLWREQQIVLFFEEYFSGEGLCFFVHPSHLILSFLRHNHIYRRFSSSEHSRIHTNELQYQSIYRHTKVSILLTEIDVAFRKGQGDLLQSVHHPHTACEGYPHFAGKHVGCLYVLVLGQQGMMPQGVKSSVRHQVCIRKTKQSSDTQHRTFQC